MDAVEALEILASGPLTTVQDLGRCGFSRYGIPPSGVLDPFSMRVANLLVGNPEGDAVIEITLMGLKVRVVTDLEVAVTGGNLQPRLNGEPLVMWRSHLLRAGDILSFGRPSSGCRAYLALGGGVAVDVVLGSRSTNLSSRFGGFEGRTLRKGDRILSRSPQRHLGETGPSLRRDWIPRYTDDPILRVLPGPQEGDFPEACKRLFLDSPFTVSLQSDRIGIRLSGPSIRKREDLPESILSEGVVPGAVQIPGDGQPIIILVETVTGGYRKIANVISADLPLLGQLKPGDRVSFREVSLQSALDALRKSEGIVRSLSQASEREEGRRMACSALTP